MTLPNADLIKLALSGEADDGIVELERRLRAVRLSADVEALNDPINSVRTPCGAGPCARTTRIVRPRSPSSFLRAWRLSSRAA